MTGLGPIVLVWLFGAVGFLQLYIAAVKLDPETMPGGGKPVMVAIAVLWPLVVVLLIIGVVLNGVNEVL